MIKSTFGALKKVAFTLVLLLLTTWANAPLLDIPALGSTPNSWQQAHTILTRQSAKIRKIAGDAQFKHKEAIKAYAIACGAALGIEEHDLSIATAKRAYLRSIATFAQAKAGENKLKIRVFKRIRRTLHKAYEYLISYLEYEEIIQNESAPATAPIVPLDLPTFQNAAVLIAAAYGSQKAPVSRVLRAPTGQRPRTSHITTTAPVRTSTLARPLPRSSQPNRRNTPVKKSSSAKNYYQTPNGCWWVTIRNYKFMLVNEAGQFKFPALCNGKVATFNDHRSKTSLKRFHLTEKERLLVFRVLFKAGISEATILKRLKHPEKFKEEIKRSARKASTRSTAKQCVVCWGTETLRQPKCSTPGCTPPLCCSPCFQKLTNCPHCRQPNLKK